jgi:hypothetical protein
MIFTFTLYLAHTNTPLTNTHAYTHTGLPDSLPSPSVRQGKQGTHSPGP